MPIAFVRDHGTMSIKTAATNNAYVAVTAATTAGNLLVAYLIYDQAATLGKPLVSSIAKAAGETANWVQIGPSLRHASSTSAGAFAAGSLWVIKTTVSWPVANYTVTLDTSVTQKATFLQEFSGVSATLRGTANGAYSATTTVAECFTGGATPVVGDLVIANLFTSNATASPTPGGSSALLWSLADQFGSTGGSSATNNYGQPIFGLIATGGEAVYLGAQPSTGATAGHGIVGGVLQPIPDPTLTQAAYRFYNDDATLAISDSYPSSNFNANYLLAGTTTQAGQSFLGDDKILSRAGFYIQRSGSPTGTFTAKLYAHTGTFGSTGVPTGAALATSSTIMDSATLSTTLGWQYFEFTGGPILTAGTPYVIALSGTITAPGGEGVFVGMDNTSPTHGGNKVNESGGSWAATSTADHIFEVYTKNGESSSTALAAQDTAITADVSNGDVNLQLRTRLQVTAGVGDVGDDYQLQWEKNASGTWMPLGFGGQPEALVASFEGTPNTGYETTGPQYTVMFGQTFLGGGGLLSRCEWNIARTGSPTGTMLSRLYPHSGTFGGADGKPANGSPPLAFSTNTRKHADMPTSAAWQSFNFTPSFVLQAGTPYSLVLHPDTVVGTAGVNNISSRGITGAGATAPGTNISTANLGSSWGVNTSMDTFHRVYEIPAGAPAGFYDSANLTDGAATTNRLTGGTGSFVAGKVSEDGLVDNLAITSGNYTELLYSLTLKAADVVSGDTLRFRVLRNGATTGLTYTQTPTINVTGTYIPREFTAYRFYADGDEAGTTLLDSYDNAGTFSFSMTSTAWASQSFVGDGKPLRRAGFYLSKSGTPTGTVSAALYAHTGTFGTSSAPTGSLLITSTTSIAATSLSTTTAWYEFDFDGSYVLANGAQFCIVVTTTNTVASSTYARIRNTGATHPGNMATFNGSTWSPSATADLIFRVYTADVNKGALAAQNTAPTVDLSSGDVNLQLRTQLQVFASDGLATDDYQLQWEKNASGTWNNVVATGLVDSFETQTTNGQLYSAYPGRGQTFLGTGDKLMRASFYLSKQNSPTGTLNAYLYAHTGTFGGDSQPTGPSLATSSTTVSAASLSTSPAWVDFEFDSTYTMVNGTPYCIVIVLTSPAAAPNYVLSGVATGTDSTHSGIDIYFDGSVWRDSPGQDTMFRIYAPVSTVIPVDSTNLTHGAATTSRLTGGTGTFVAGKVSEDGLVDDLAITASNYSELLYSLTLKQADLTNGDTLRFRVLRNGATTDLTYTATPTININAGVVVPKIATLIDTFDTTLDKTVKWVDSSASVVWDAPGRVKIPCTASYPALWTAFDGEYDLAESSVFAKVVPPPLGSGSRMTAMTVVKGGDGGTYLRIVLSGEYLYAEQFVSNAAVDSQLIAYSATDHVWWRIRESGGTAYFDTSPDSQIWTNHWSYATQFAVTQVSLMFNSGYWGTEAASDAYIDNINLPGPKELSDSANISDTYQIQTFISRSETISLSDVSSERVAIDRQESVNLSDVRAAAVAVDRTDSQNLIDTKALTVNKDMPDGIGLTDIKALSVVKDVPDAIGLIDTRTLAVTKDLTDIVGLIDTKNLAVSIQRQDISGLIDTSTAIIQAAATGRPKVWMGSEHANKPAKVWTGSAWIEKPVKSWTGSQWKPAS